MVQTLPVEENAMLRLVQHSQVKQDQQLLHEEDARMQEVAWLREEVIQLREKLLRLLMENVQLYKQDRLHEVECEVLMEQCDQYQRESYCLLHTCRSPSNAKCHE